MGHYRTLKYLLDVQPDSAWLCGFIYLMKLKYNETPDMIRAIQEAIPCVKKFFRNLRRSSSVVAAECIGDPSLYVSHKCRSKLDIPFALTRCGSSCVAMSDLRLQIIKLWDRQITLF